MTLSYNEQGISQAESIYKYCPLYSYPIIECSVSTESTIDLDPHQTIVSTWSIDDEQSTATVNQELCCVQTDPELFDFQSECQSRAHTYTAPTAESDSCAFTGVAENPPLLDCFTQNQSRLVLE